MDRKKQCLIVNVINFLQDELQSENLNDERKESVEVAIQCLETAFEIPTDMRDNVDCELVDLLSCIPYKPKVDISDEAKVVAEECKNRGNTFMRNNDYFSAVVEYTKAIGQNPYNAVYYCNRAAAYSRLERHHDSIADCNEAIRLDPTYSKAHSRLGISYSNLNQDDEACKAYKVALKYDPTNEMYATNLKLAEEKILAKMGKKENAAPPEHRPVDISQFINNPNLINMATQMMSDPNFRNMMTGLMSMDGTGESLINFLESNNRPSADGMAPIDPSMDTLLQAGQSLANRMQTADPTFVETLRRSLDSQLAASLNTAASSGNSADQAPRDEGNESNDQPPPQP